MKPVAIGSLAKTDCFTTVLTKRRGCVESIKDRCKGAILVFLTKPAERKLLHVGVMVVPK